MNQSPARLRSMPSNAKANPDDIDIVSLWGAVRRGLPRLLVLTIGAGILTYATLSTMALRYTSEAQLAIVAKSTNPFPDGREKMGGADSVTPRMDKEAINTQVRALLSTDLLLKVANKLKLAELPEFNPRAGDLDLFSKITRLLGQSKIRAGETVDDTVLAIVTRQLEIASPRESRAISIRFSSADPRSCRQLRQPAGRGLSRLARVRHRRGDERCREGVGAQGRAIAAGADRGRDRDRADASADRPHDRRPAEDAADRSASGRAHRRAVARGRAEERCRLEMARRPRVDASGRCWIAAGSAEVAADPEPGAATRPPRAKYLRAVGVIVAGPSAHAAAQC